jgi:hypothetical protein
MNPIAPERKRMKCARGIPTIHQECKSPRSVALTDTAVKMARQFGELCGANSLSESIETIIRLMAPLKTEAQVVKLTKILDKLGRSEVNQESERFLINPEQ